MPNKKPIKVRQVSLAQGPTYAYSTDLWLSPSTSPNTGQLLKFHPFYLVFTWFSPEKRFGPLLRSYIVVVIAVVGAEVGNMTFLPMGETLDHVDEGRSGTMTV